MFTTNFGRSLMVSAFCLTALACTGNDARKCKIAPLSNGDVRMVCPGGRTIVVPAGKDSESLPDDCEGVVVGNVVELSCGNQSVDLGACGAGFAGDLLLGSPSDLGFSPWQGFSDAQNAANIEAFEEQGCTKLLGNLYVDGASIGTYRPLLERLQYAERVKVLGSTVQLRIPELVAAHIDLGDASVASLDVPKLERGGLSMNGGQYDGSLLLPEFREGVVAINDVVGLELLSLPRWESGSLSLSNLNDLTTLHTPNLRRASSVQISEVFGIERLDFNSLEWANSILLGSNNSLASFAAPRLVGAPNGIEIYGSRVLGELAFPVLQTASFFSVSESDELERLVLPELQIVNSLQVFNLPALNLFEAPRITRLMGELHFAGNGEISGVSFSAPELIEVAGLQIGGSQFVSFKAPKLESTDYDPIEFLEARYIEQIDLSSLRNTGLTLETAINAEEKPLSIQLTRFVYTHSPPASGDPNWPVRLVVGHDAPVDIDFSEALINTPIHIEVGNPRSGWDFHSGFSGVVRLQNIRAANQIIFRNAANLPAIYVNNVGSRNSLLDGVFGTRGLRIANVVDSYLAVFSAGLSDDAAVTLTNTYASVVAIEGSPNAFPSLTIEYLSTNTNDAFMSVVSASLEALQLRMNTPQTGQYVAFDLVSEGDIFIHSDSVESVSFSSLFEGQFELQSLSIRPEQVNVPSNTSNLLVGQFVASWDGLECPSHILSAWPNVSLLPTGCL